MKKKVLIVFGTRPEAIKMAPLIKEFDKHKELIEYKVCLTAQHREMLDQVMKIFDIKADYDLNLMKPGQNLTDITVGVLNGLKPILEQYQPDLVLVHGDTSTSSSAALAAYYQQIEVGHVEAGLRTNNIYSPWPEEMNRQITGRIANYHFAPTEWAASNLIKENIEQHKIVITGNTVVDAIQFALKKIQQDPTLEKKIVEEINQQIPTFELIKDSKIILITGHRRENFGEGFVNICAAIKDIAERHPDTNIIYPVHLNPNVQNPVNTYLKNIENVHLISPLDYLPFIYLMNRSYLVLTDSGGIQEEAPGIGKPVLVMRNTTERPEGVKAGTVKLVGTDRGKILSEVTSLLTNDALYETMSKATNPYGNGEAAKLICKSILDIVIV